MAEDPRADHAQVPGALRGPAQESPGQRRPLSVQEHLSAGQRLPREEIFALHAALDHLYITIE